MTFWACLLGGSPLISSDVSIHAGVRQLSRGDIMVIELLCQSRWTPRQHPVNPVERERCQLEVPVESLFAHTCQSNERKGNIEIESRGLMGWKEAPVWGRNCPKRIKKKRKIKNLAQSFSWNQRDQVHRSCPLRLSHWCQNSFQPFLSNPWFQRQCNVYLGTLSSTPAP